MTITSFFSKQDPFMNDIVLPLPPTWWSRPYEYVWASQFAKGTVLDAACGISHPFKFYLIDRCQQVYGCDWDQRILSHQAILHHIGEEFGEAGKQFVEQQAYLDQIHLTHADLSAMPYPDEMFDTVFCISVFEHIPDHVKPSVLREFRRTMKEDGRLIMTLDYPLASPELMLNYVDECGFVLTEPHDFSIPEGAITGQSLMCYRMSLCKA